MKESKQIRELLEDIKEIQNKLNPLNETYMFGKKEESLGENDFVEKEEPSFDSMKKDAVTPVGSNIDSQVKEIRKIALSVISNLSPSDDQESYRLVKDIWDKCDKYLTRGEKNEKQAVNQNKIN